MNDINLNGWVQKRRGVLSHLQTGRITLHEYLVFDILLLLADKATGTGMTNAKAVSFWTNGQLSEDGADRTLRSLEKKNYIVREITPGRLGVYPYHVQKYVIAYGADVGKIVTWKKNSTGVEKTEELLRFFEAEAADEGAAVSAPHAAEPTAVVSAELPANEGADVTIPDTRNQIPKTKNSSSTATALRSPDPKQKRSTKEEPFDPIAYAKTLRSDGNPDARPLVQKLIESSGHWRFKRTVAPQDRELATTAFEKLLKLESPQHILNVLTYTVGHAEFGTGLKTVNKEYPWDWFVINFDRIAAQMEADDQKAARLKQRADKLAAVSVDAKKNANLPDYRKNPTGRDFMRGEKL